VTLLVRLGIALLLVLFGLVSYCTTTVDNPITGEKQRVHLATAGGGVGTTGAIRNGGSVWRSLQTIYSSSMLIRWEVVQKSVVKSAISSNSICCDLKLSMLSLPGGQVFLTAGLLRRLSSEAQLAAVLGHEVDVVGRHAAEHKQQLAQRWSTQSG